MAVAYAELELRDNSREVAACPAVAAAVQPAALPWLDNARIAAIFAVVVLHSASRIVGGNALGSADWWVGNIVDSAVRWCVPVFVMISGALLLDPAKDESLSTFYKKRLARLLLPLLFWSAFFLYWRVLMAGFRASTVALGELAYSLLTGQPYFHLWFLYMIFPLYVFTPFLRVLVRASSRNELWVLTGLGLALSGLTAAATKVVATGTDLFFTWFLLYLPLFLLGHLLRTTSWAPSKGLLWTALIALVALTALGVFVLGSLAGEAVGMYFYHYLSITVVPMSVCVVMLLKAGQAPLFGPAPARRLASLALGVYLIHPVVRDLLTLAGLGPLDLHPLIAIPFLVFTLTGVSLVLAAAIQAVPYLRRVI